MKSLMKWISIIVATTLAVVIILAVVLTQVIDPNDYKGDISSLAKEQGVDLQFKGKLGWTFFPRVGVSLKDIHLTPLPQPSSPAIDPALIKTPLVSLSSAAAYVDVMSLFSGQISISAVDIDGAVINLLVNKNGQNNWELLSKTPDPKKESTAPATDTGTASGLPAGLSLAMHSFRISNSELHLDDRQQKQKVDLSQLSVRTTNVNINQQAFPLEVSFALQTAQPSLALTTELKSNISIKSTLDGATLSDGQLNLTLQKPGSKTSPLPIKLSFNVTATNEGNAEGAIKLVAINLKKLLPIVGQPAPETQKASALTRVGFDTQFKASPTTFSLKPLTLNLDDTTFNGEVTLKDIASSDLFARLQGDQLNVDHYLPPAPAPETQTDPAASKKKTPKAGKKKPKADPVLIPLEVLRPLKLDVRLGLKQMTASGLSFEKVAAHVTARDGLITLKQLHTDFYQGTIDAKGTLNARGKTAIIKTNAKVDSVQLEGVVKDLGVLNSDGKEAPAAEAISGVFNTTLTANTRGLRESQLINALKAQLNLDAKQLLVTPINLEQYYCEAAAKLSGKAAPSPSDSSAWPTETKLRDLDGQVTVKKGIATVKNFSAGVENIQLATRGKINIKNQNFNLILPMTLAGSATSKDGCRVKSKFLQNRELSLVRCKGSLATLDPASDCGLDKGAFNKLLKDLAKYKAGKKVDEQKTKLLDKVKDKYGEGAGELLKGLFK